MSGLRRSGFYMQDRKNAPRYFEPNKCRNDGDDVCVSVSAGSSGEANDYACARRVFARCELVAIQKS
jgi:hypothetical protein